MTLRLRDPEDDPRHDRHQPDSATWDADPSAPGSAGTAGNLPAGTVRDAGRPPTSDSTITLQSGPAVVGQGAEQPALLLLRIQFKMRSPNGGNGTDYSGLGRERHRCCGQPRGHGGAVRAVYPNHYGDGSPLLLLWRPGAASVALTPSVLATIATGINGAVTLEESGPWARDCTVLSGYMPDARQLTHIIRNGALEDSPPRFRLGTRRHSLCSWLEADCRASDLGHVGRRQRARDPRQRCAGVAEGCNLRAGQPSDRSTPDMGTGLPQGPVIPESSGHAWPTRMRWGLTTLALRVPNVANFDLWTQVGNLVSLAAPSWFRSVRPCSRIPTRLVRRVLGLADRAQLWNDTIGVTTLSTAAESTLDADGVTKLVARCIAGGVKIGIGGATQACKTSPPATTPSTARRCYARAGSS